MPYEERSLRFIKLKYMFGAYLVFNRLSIYFEQNVKFCI